MITPWPYPDDSAFPDDGAYWDTEDRPGPRTEDRELAALVAHRLSVDWTTRRQQITVSVQNRVVILAGMVNTERARRIAGELAWDVPGVHDVCNTIQAARPGR